jgi:hypothetical protein
MNLAISRAINLAMNRVVNRPVEFDSTMHPSVIPWHLDRIGALRRDGYCR